MRLLIPILLIVFTRVIFAQSDASQLNIKQSGTGAVSRTIEDTQNDVINASSYGALCNNNSGFAMVHNDTAGINAALVDTHNNGVANLPRTNGSTYGQNWCVVDSTVFMLGGQILRGANEANTFIVPSATFPANTPIIQMFSLGPEFGTRLEHLTVSCVPINFGYIPGCIGIEANNMQEGSGLFNVGVQGATTGILLDPGFGNQNGSIDGLQVYGVPGPWEAGLSDGWCIKGTNVISRYRWKNITCNGDQVTSSVIIPHAAILFSGSQIAIEDVHCEVTDYCVEGVNSQMEGDNITGSNLTTVYFPSGQNSDYSLRNISGSGGTSVNALTDASTSPVIHCDSGTQGVTFFAKQQNGNLFSTDPSCGANFVNTQIIGAGLNMGFGSLMYYKNVGLITGAFDLGNRALAIGQGGGTYLGFNILSYNNYGHFLAAKVAAIAGLTIVGSPGDTCNVIFPGSGSGDAATGHLVLPISIGDSFIIDNQGQGYSNPFGVINSFFVPGGTATSCIGNPNINNVVVSDTNTGAHIQGGGQTGLAPNFALFDTGNSSDTATFTSNNGASGSGSSSGVILDSGHLKLWGNFGLTKGVVFSPHVKIDISDSGISLPLFGSLGILGYSGSLITNNTPLQTINFLGGGFTPTGVPLQFNGSVLTSVTGFTGTITYLKDSTTTCTVVVTNGSWGTPTGAGCP